MSEEYLKLCDEIMNSLDIIVENDDDECFKNLSSKSSICTNMILYVAKKKYHLQYSYWHKLIEEIIKTKKFDTKVLHSNDHFLILHDVIALMIALKKTNELSFIKNNIMSLLHNSIVNNEFIDKIIHNEQYEKMINEQNPKTNITNKDFNIYDIPVYREINPTIILNNINPKNISSCSTSTFSITDKTNEIKLFEWINPTNILGMSVLVFFATVVYYCKNK